MSTEQEIRQAALREFIKEGVSGARTQVIADQIGVTKAMIHYYFKTKENLFREVYRQASETMMEGVMEVLEQETPLFPKIEAFIDRLLDRLADHPELAGFVVNELRQHPDITKPLFDEACNYQASVFEGQLEQAASEYRVAPVAAEQVVANMVSLCLFPYTGRPFLASLLGQTSDNDFDAFLNKRREVIKDTILNWMAG